MEKIKKLIVLTIVLTVVFACAGCANKSIDTTLHKTMPVAIQYPNSTLSDATADTTATDDDLATTIEAGEIDEIQTELEDSDLNNIDKELGDIDW